MKVKISKWGNSLVLLLPSSITKHLQIQEGDKLDANLNSQNELVLTPKKPFDKAKFIQNVLALRKTLPETTSVIDIMRDQERY